MSHALGAYQPCKNRMASNAATAKIALDFAIAAC